MGHISPRRVLARGLSTWQSAMTTYTLAVEYFVAPAPVWRARAETREPNSRENTTRQLVLPVQVFFDICATSTYTIVVLIVPGTYFTSRTAVVGGY